MMKVDRDNESGNRTQNGLKRDGKGKMVGKGLLQQPSSEIRPEVAEFFFYHYLLYIQQLLLSVWKTLPFPENTFPPLCLSSFQSFSRISSLSVEILPFLRDP